MLDREDTIKLLETKRELECVKLEREIDKLEAETRRWTVEATRAERDLEYSNATAEEHMIYNFFGRVNPDSIAIAMETLGVWSRRRPEEPITIIFNSPGGSVIDGLALYDYIDQLKKQGHHITTVARGMAASMGGILLQCGDERIVGESAHMLIHEVSAGAIGRSSDIEDELKFIGKLQDRLLTILARRSTLTKSQIKRKWSRKDWWLDSAEVVELGFADKIG